MAEPKLRELHRLVGRDGVARVMGRFYDRVREDPELAPFFAHISDWDAHKAHIGRFWWRDLGGEPEIPGEVFNPHDVHRHFGVTPEAVDRWLALFEQTLAEELPAELARVWIARARRMGEWTRQELARAPRPRARSGDG